MLSSKVRHAGRAAVYCYGSVLSLLRPEASAVCACAMLITPFRGRLLAASQLLKKASADIAGRRKLWHCTAGVAWQQGHHPALWGRPNSGCQMERQPHSLGERPGRESIRYHCAPVHRVCRAAKVQVTFRQNIPCSVMISVSSRGCIHPAMLCSLQAHCIARWDAAEGMSCPISGWLYCLCSLRLEKLQCHLFWEGESLLHIGWADSVKVARVRAAAAGAASVEGRRSLDIVASFQIDCLVAVHASPLLEHSQSLVCAVFMCQHAGDSVASGKDRADWPLLPLS